MDQFFNSISGIDFGRRFTSNEDCADYLYQIKWQNGYHCRVCKHPHYIKGRTLYHRRCQKCMYDESVICHTMFAHTRIPLLKAFHMVFRTVSKKKGISSYELGTEVGIQQKTAWKFKLKIKNAMIQAEENAVMERESGGKALAGSDIKVDRQQNSEATAMDRNIQINTSGDLQPAMKEDTLSAETATCETANEIVGSEGSVDRDYSPASPGKIPTYSGRPIPWSKLKGMPGYMISLHLWLRGIHHHHSKKYESTYYDEYFYRLNNRHDREPLFHRTLIRFIQATPKTYRTLTAPRVQNGSLNSILMRQEPNASHFESQNQVSPTMEPA